MSITKRGIALAAVATTVAAAGGVLTAVPAFAATPSAYPLYLISGNDATALPATGNNWKTTPVLGSPIAHDETASTNFPDPASFTQVQTFIATPGTEDNPAGWLGFGAGGGWGPNLTPNDQIDNPFVAGDFHDLLPAGGDFSIGEAWVNGTQQQTETLVQVVYTTIHIDAGGSAATGGSFEWTPPVVATAPTITTTSLGALVTGTAFTQTIAATGSTPITWSVSAGSLPAGLSLAASTGVISGTPTTAGAYSFTLKASNGTAPDATQAFSGTVTAPLPTVPTKPIAGDANELTITDPAMGATSLAVTGLTASHTYQVWAWSDPTNLGQVTTDAAGAASVPLGTLPAGNHTIAFTNPGDATLTVQAWGTFSITANAGDPISKTIDLTATVTASDLWQLDAAKTAIDFGNVVRGTTSGVQTLGKVTVVDDRTTLKGWDLNASATAFTKGTDTIPATALSITPKAFTGYTPLTGITVGATAGTGSGTLLASSTPVTTTPTGALFDADLTFAAPANAQGGLYNSTLTITLTSH